MKNSLIWMSSLLLFGALFTFTSCDDDDDNPMEMDPQNIVEFAANSDDYTILAEAVQAAGLDDALSGDGPFTVFAPDNAAFQALLDSNDDWNALSDIPTATLSAVLTNHVLAGDAVMSSDLQDAYYTTLSETSYDGALTSLYVNLDDGVTLNGGPTVQVPDVEVSNGVIHGVDAVIGLPNIVTFATSNPALSSLVAALTRSDLTTDFVGTLNGDGPFTVFAPSNAAFQALLDSDPDWNELADIPVATLEAVLSYHVTSAGNVRSSDLMDDMDVPTLNGESLTVDLSGSDVVIEGNNSSATVILPNIQGTNGVVHVIDTVLLP